MLKVPRVLGRAETMHNQTERELRACLFGYLWGTLLTPKCLLGICWALGLRCRPSDRGCGLLLIPRAPMLLSNTAGLHSLVRQACDKRQCSEETNNVCLCHAFPSSRAAAACILFFVVGQSGYRVEQHPRETNSRRCCCPNSNIYTNIG